MQSELRESRANQRPAGRPLCVDLDGTLIRTDLLWESLLEVAREAPLDAARACLRVSNRARLKRYLAERSSIVPADLPYQEKFLAWLRAQRAAGRRLVLATASDELLARRVADHLRIFDEVIASDGDRNLKSEAKAASLLASFPQGFDYAGNSAADLPVWDKAVQSVAVDPGTGVLQRLESGRAPEAVFPAPGGSSLALWVKAFGVRWWAANFLLVIPIAIFLRRSDPAFWAFAAWLFAAFSLSGSSVCILSDLLNLQYDRKDSEKRRKPFASGALTIPSGMAAAIAAIIGGFAAALMVGRIGVLITAAFALLLGIYSLRPPTRQTRFRSL